MKVKMKSFSSLVMVFALISMNANALATSKHKGGDYPAGTPTRAIQDLDDMLDDFKTGKNLPAADQAFNKQLKKKIIHGTFDIRELARLALDQHWLKRTPEQQNHFVNLLVDLLEEKALFSKEQSLAKSSKGGKYFVVYYGNSWLDKQQSRAKVRTKVVVPSENIDIELNYKLKKEDSSWKIYDVIVDDASLLENYRYQFDAIIKKHGYGELVRRMENKLTNIKRERQDL